MRCFGCCLAALVSTILLGAGSTSLAQSPDFPEEASEKWRQYIKEFRRFQVTQKTITYDLTAGEKVIHASELDFKQANQNMLFIQCFKDEGSKCWSRNSKYAFELTKRKKDPAWRISDLDKDISEGIRISYIKSQFTEDFCGGFTPFGTIASGWLPKITKQSGFKILQTEKVLWDGSDCAKFCFELTPDEETKKRRGGYHIEGKGWFILDPKRYWRLCECEFPVVADNNSWRTRQHITIQCDVVHGDFPILKSIETLTSSDEQTSPTHRTKDEYTIEERVPSEDEFKLSAFGLPEPNFPKPPPWWSYSYVWLSLAAISCFALALLFGWYRRRTGQG
jgi:hypothetical protein